MSSGWSWFVIILTVANIVGCWWLLRANTGKEADEPAADETLGHVWDGNLEEYNQPLPRWWLILFYLTIVFGVVYLLLYPALGNFDGLIGWSQEQQYEAELQQAREKYSVIYDRLADLSIEELARDEQAVGIGHRLYVNNCSVCHGSDGRGAPTFPNLADDDWLYGGEPAAILTSIVNGRAGVMPALGNTMSDETIDDVVNYVRSLSGLEHDAARAAAGKNQFAVCAACHGQNGGGNQVLGAPNLTDDVWLYGSAPAEIRAGIVNGRANRMPAHEDLLGAERARIVAAYVYQLADGEPVR